MNYSSNSSDDFSGLSEQIKAVASGRQTGDNSSDEASSDYESSIISQTEIMMKRRYKAQLSEEESGVGGKMAVASSSLAMFGRVLATSGSNSSSSNSGSNSSGGVVSSSSNSNNSAGSGNSGGGCVSSSSTFPLTMMGGICCSPTTSHSSTHSLKSLKGAVKRLRCRLDESFGQEEETLPKAAAGGGGGVSKQSKNCLLMVRGSQHKDSSSPRSMTSIQNCFLPSGPSGLASEEEEEGLQGTGMTQDVDLKADLSEDKKKHLGKNEEEEESLQQQGGKLESSRSYDDDDDEYEEGEREGEGEDFNCSVDVRLIDFAHTAFKPGTDRTILLPSNQIKIHHGPDNGFLTGIDSLYRLLNEILSEDSIVTSVAI